MRQGQFAILISQRIGGYIANDDRFFEVNSPSARPCFRADDAATKSIYVAGRKAGRRAMHEALTIRVQQEN